MLWLFGIHQAVIYSAILEPLLLINITENIAAANNGQAIPHIINLSQVQTFALMGGSGSTLCLLVATFLVSRNAASKNVAKLSLDLDSSISMNLYYSVTQSFITFH